MSATAQPSYSPPVALTYQYRMLNVEVDSQGTYTVVGENNGTSTGGFTPVERGANTPNYELVARLNELGKASWEVEPTLPREPQPVLPQGPQNAGKRFFQILLRQRLS